ncbi:MAG: hypothetical protein OXK80_04900 [Bdellovibrionales bacterium]|nr:hypothetical protein [Bdellovibrionales bacterium]
MKEIIKKLFSLSFIALSGTVWASFPYTIINSTDYDVEMYMLWNNFPQRNVFYLKEVISAGECIQIDKIQFNYELDSCEAPRTGVILRCVDWFYVNRGGSLFDDKKFTLLINDEEDNVHRVILNGGRLNNYEIVGEKNNVLGVFDNFDLITHSPRSEFPDDCRVFYPENALPVEEHSMSGLRVMWPF